MREVLCATCANKDSSFEQLPSGKYAEAAICLYSVATFPHATTCSSYMPEIEMEPEDDNG